MTRVLRPRSTDASRIPMEGWAARRIVVMAEERAKPELWTDSWRNWTSSGTPRDPRKGPFVVFDPRAGHGPGIGGSKVDSEIGVALRAGHPFYFVGFRAEPVPGQTLEDVGRAEGLFLQKIAELHPEADGRPCLVGNCQAGW